MLEFSELETVRTGDAGAPSTLAESAPALATVCVVGLGYVGLPVAVEFGKQRATIGYDLSAKKVERLRQFDDATGEVPAEELKRARHLRVTTDPNEIGSADFVIVAGDDDATLEKVADLYASVVKAGVHRASSIKVAEAAKVIENTQRDLNIAFVNELAIIFDRLGLDTAEVLNAAGTKWNFLPFRPGLVGGHCIGVDPYYLTHKAELAGYHPEVILAGRRINDGMGAHIARKAVQQMIHAGRNIKGAPVNVLGLTFKENCPDIRNSKVVDIIHELRQFGVETFVHDPAADAVETLHEYDIRLRAWEELPVADALVLAVAHRRFLDLPASAYLQKIVRRGCLIDVKSVFDPAPFRKEGLRVWRL